MTTRVYVQYDGGSGLDARYIGTVNDSPNVVAKSLRAIENVINVKIYGNEVIAFSSRPY